MRKSERRPGLGPRILQMKREGKTFPEVIEGLEKEGYRSKKGEPYGNKEVMAAYYRAMRDEDRRPAKGDTPITNETPVTDNTKRVPEAENDDTSVTRRELAEALSELETRLITMIHQSPTVTIDAQDVPPRPKGRPKDRLRHVRAVMDRALYSELEAYAARHHGGNLSSALSAIVWRALGRPRLSFEKGEDA